MAQASRKRFIVALVIFILSLAGALATYVARRDSETQLPRADLPYNEDFSTAGTWRTESDATAQVTIEGGVLRLSIAVPNQLAWASAGYRFSDFRLTVEATQVAGPDDNEYGVLTRMKDNGHFYRFSISGDGYYKVSKYDVGADDDEQWQELGDDWTPSEAIRLGTATNLLEVVCQGTAMTFSVNGVQLAQVEDSSYRRGDIGLYAGSFFTPDVEIHFDNLRVEQP